MPAERYFVEGNFHTGSQVKLEGQEHHHLVHVMRAKAGESVELINGAGELAIAIISQIEKKRATLEIQKISKEPKPGFEIVLAQATPRINRLDFILEKGTELGMTQLWLFPGDNSERKSLTEHQLDRMRSLVIAAMKQCGRLYLPTISQKSSLTNWKQQEFPCFFGDVGSEAPPLAKAWQNTSHSNGVIFFIGPESGFSDKEEKALKDLGALGVKLHDNILRTDTAALAALAQIWTYS